MSDTEHVVEYKIKVSGIEEAQKKVENVSKNKDKEAEKNAKRFDKNLDNAKLAAYKEQKKREKRVDESFDKAALSRQKQEERTSERQARQAQVQRQREQKALIKEQLNNLKTIEKAEKQQQRERERAATKALKEQERQEKLTERDRDTRAKQRARKWQQGGGFFNFRNPNLGGIKGLIAGIGLGIAARQVSRQFSGGVASLGSSFSQGIVGNVSGSMKGLVSSIGGIGGAVTGAVGSGLGGIAGGAIGAGLGGLGGALGGLGTGALGIGGLVGGGLGGAIGGGVVGAGLGVAGGSLLGKAVEGLAGVVNKIIDILDSMVAEFAKFNPALAYATAIFKYHTIQFDIEMGKITQPITTAWMKIKTDFLDSIVGLAKVMAPLVDVFAKALDSVDQFIRKIDSFFGIDPDKQFTGIGNKVVVDPVMGIRMESTGTPIKSTGNKPGDIWQTFRDGSKESWDYIKDLAKTFWTTDLLSIAKEFWDKSVKFWDDTAKPALEKFWDTTAKPILINFIEWLKPVIVDAMSAIGKEIFSRLFPSKTDPDIGTAAQAQAQTDQAASSPWARFFAHPIDYLMSPLENLEKETQHNAYDIYGNGGMTDPKYEKQGFNKPIGILEPFLGYPPPVSIPKVSSPPTPKVSPPPQIFQTPGNINGLDTPSPYNWDSMQGMNSLPSMTGDLVNNKGIPIGGNMPAKTEQNAAYLPTIQGGITQNINVELQAKIMHEQAVKNAIFQVQDKLMNCLFTARNETRLMSSLIAGHGDALGF